MQHVFSKRSLVNLISKDTNLVFYLSANQVDSLFELVSEYDTMIIFNLRHFSKSRSSSGSTPSVRLQYFRVPSLRNL